AMLTQAARSEPMFALMPGDRFVHTRMGHDPVTISPAALTEAVNRARREALATADPVVLRGNDLGQEVIFDILSGANAFAFVGDVEGAAAVIRIADQLRRLILPPGAMVDAYGDDRVWQSGRLAALHAAVGSPPYELRELWRQVSRVARGSTPRERPIRAWAGASAAQGLLVGPAADPAAVDALQQLTGVPPRPEFKALEAIVRHDSAGARRALATRGMGHEKS